MRRLFRWAFRLALLLLVLTVLAVVAGILLMDTIAREALVSRIRKKTGMDVKISTVHIGLMSPTINIEGLKLYNRPEFGGSLCLDMPELHIDYDLSAFRARKLHLTLVRLDLAQLSILQTRDGRNNFDYTPPKKTKVAAKNVHVSGKFEFVEIDTLNVSFGKFRMSNTGTGSGMENTLNITNEILHHVKNMNDLAPLGIMALNRLGNSNFSTVLTGIVDDP
jgi:hypothetical protein